MTFHDINELVPISGLSGPSSDTSSDVLINNLSYLNDTSLLPIDKRKSIGPVCNVGQCPNDGNGRKAPIAVAQSAVGRKLGMRCEDKSNIGWITIDSTTLDAQKATRFCLDSMPMNAYRKDLWSIYDEDSDVTKYKSVYYHRNELPGQIQYYVEPDMGNPFFSPLFPRDTKGLGAVYIDPMGSVSYDFRRSTGSCNGPKQPLRCDDCEIGEFRDLQNHREDMQAAIMRKRNRREYEPVFFNFTARYNLPI